MIFCVEDDDAIRNMMLYTLHASGFEAEGFHDGSTFFAALENHRPKLILLDIMLPGMDGIEILKQIRSQGATKHIPVIMASAKGTEYDKVLGLDLGADDYLAKPFGMLEMVSRVKAVLRRTEPMESEQVLRMGQLELNTREHTVRIDGESVVLTLKEYELLRLFWEISAVCSAVTSFWIWSGVKITTVKPEPLTSTSVHSEPNSVSAAIGSAPSAVSGIAWRKRHDPTNIPFDLSGSLCNFPGISFSDHGCAL